MWSIRNIIQKTFQSAKMCLQHFPKAKNIKLLRNAHTSNVSAFGKYDIVRPQIVSDQVDIPAYIPQPSYSQSSIPEEGPEIPEIKDAFQIESMRHSCKLARCILCHVDSIIKPGITTDFLNNQLHDVIIANGAYPSPLNYYGFPKSICTSVNNVACHGIPDNRPLQDGDILNVDITVYLNGYHGDCSTMFQVGDVDEEGKRLISVTELCLKSAIEICKPDEHFCNIGNVIEEIANKHNFNVIPAFTGHGIGTYFHGPPDILHFGIVNTLLTHVKYGCTVLVHILKNHRIVWVPANSYSGKMKAGMTFTIEPVLSQGMIECEILEDGWTACTVDNSRTAQMEHTILITDTGCEVLTL